MSVGHKGMFIPILIWSLSPQSSYPNLAWFIFRRRGTLDGISLPTPSF